MFVTVTSLLSENFLVNADNSTMSDGLA